MVAAGVADQILVQISYAIGIAEPLSVYVDTYGTAKVALSDGEIAARVAAMFDLRPASIVKRFGLKNPIFEATSSYGHFGTCPYTAEVTVFNHHKEERKKVEFFGWEKLDCVEELRKAFQL
jgi:S-adenosylmethionine synthetase